MKDLEHGWSDASLLDLADVAVGPPTHRVRRGEVYRVGRHVLACVDVITGWRCYIPFLAELDATVGAAELVPHPGPYALCSLRAARVPLVLVQPDPFLAGHLLDKYAAVHGEQGIRLAIDPDQL